MQSGSISGDDCNTIKTKEGMAFFMLGDNTVGTAAVIFSRHCIFFACLPDLFAACILPVAAPRITSAHSYKPYKDLYR